jgi:hypothetical protein
VNRASLIARCRTARHGVDEAIASPALRIRTCLTFAAEFNQLVSLVPKVGDGGAAALFRPYDLDRLPLEDGSSLDERQAYLSHVQRSLAQLSAFLEGGDPGQTTRLSAARCLGERPAPSIHSRQRERGTP